MYKALVHIILLLVLYNERPVGINHLIFPENAECQHAPRSEKSLIMDHQRMCSNFSPPGRKEMLLGNFNKSSA